MKKTIKICERCGEPYSYREVRKTEHNVYIYNVHVTKIGNRRKIRKCYLGAQSTYKYVERMHRDIELNLRGMHDHQRIVDYLKAIIEYFNSILIKKEYEEISEEEKRLLKELGKILEELNWEITYILNENK